jgi:hypothetical protein
MIFDPEIHIVLFNSCLENETMRQAFMKHLHKEFNTAPLLFLSEAKEFQNLEKTEDIKKHFKLLYEKYIKKDGVNELNMSGPMKAKLEKKYERIDKKETVTKEKKLIDLLSTAISQELHLDSVIFIF